MEFELGDKVIKGGDKGEIIGINRINNTIRIEFRKSSTTFEKIFTINHIKYIISIEKRKEKIKKLLEKI